MQLQNDGLGRLEPLKIYRKTHNLCLDLSKSIQSAADLASSLMPMLDRMEQRVHPACNCPVTCSAAPGSVCHEAARQRVHVMYAKQAPHTWCYPSYTLSLRVVLLLLLDNEHANEHAT